MLYLTNAFSINMITSHPTSHQSTLEFTPISLGTAIIILKANSSSVINAIGHPATAAIVADQLQLPLPPAERATILFTEKDVLLVAQYTGPRLPEGATTLPTDATIAWWLVSHA